MHRRTTSSAPRRRPSRDRGAALILTVIVIMVLTTLGMAMVTFTTTEERTATTYRDSLQTRALAEAGVRVVQEMFRSPGDHNLVPLYSAVQTVASTTNPPVWDYYGTGADPNDIDPALNAIGIWRKDRSGATPARYSGNNNRFFFPPFRATWSQTFGGTYSTTAGSDNFDLRFNCRDANGTSANLIANAATKCWLETNINSKLLTGTAPSTDWNLRPGTITDISFYAPPAVAGSSYGITTVRVTAEKWDRNNLLARETVVALIGDRNPEPAVLGNGNIRFITQAGVMCGNGCENIHANGNAEVGSISGGQPPMVTATGTVAVTSGSSQASASVVTSPAINPWDDAYKPSSAADLGLFYLVTSGPLPVIWTDMDATNNSPSRQCGFSTCQDYGLEYPAGSTTANTERLAADVPWIYKWNATVAAEARWDSTGCATPSGTTLVCNGLSFDVTRIADLEDVTWTGDNPAAEQYPYNPYRVPRTEFQITSILNGATVLVDGKFAKRANGNWNPSMSIISAGSLTLASNTDWYPASATQRVMWISGRDILMSANCCTTANQCATNLANMAAQGIIAAHEQIQASAQTALAGIVIAENKVNRDLTVDNTATGYALDVRQGDHDYACGVPSWPWVRGTIPEIFSMTTATD